MTSPSTSLSLLDRLRDGDAETWQRMNDLYSPLMHARLRPCRVQPSDVQDITQIALTIVLRRLPEFQHNGRTGAFRTWLRGIVGNVLREHRRAADRRPVADDALLAELVDTQSELNRRWDIEHDRYILRGLMKLVAADFRRPPGPRSSARHWTAVRQRSSPRNSRSP